MEFLITISLQFTHMPEIIKDSISIYEFNQSLVKYCKSNGVEKDAIIEQKELLAYFGGKFSFDYERNSHLGTRSELIKDRSFWKYFDYAEQYNSNCNKSLLYFYCVSQNEKARELWTTLSEKFKDKMGIPVSDFLEKIALFQANKDKFSDMSVRAQAIGTIVVSAIKAVYDFIHNKFSSKKPRHPESTLSNLCIIGNLIHMRDFHDEFEYSQTVFNINLCWNMLERKLFLDDYFFRMNKFGMMKMTAVTLAFPMSNIVEFCVNPPLFSHEYVDNMVMAKGEAARAKVKSDYVENTLLNYNNYMMIGTLGPEIGGFYDYMYSMQEFFNAEDWEFVSMQLAVSDFLVGDINEEPFEHPDAEYLWLYKNCKSGDKIFQSKFAMLNVYETEGYGEAELKEIPDERMKFKNPKYKRPKTPEEAKAEEKEEKEEEKKNNNQKGKKKGKKGPDEVMSTKDNYDKNLYDCRTGMQFKALKQKLLDIERTVMNYNMILLQQVIKGNSTVLLDKRNAIGKKSGDTPKLYRALIGLQGYKKIRFGNRKLFKEYLGVLSNNKSFSSDLTRIDEILTFALTKKISLNQVVNVLEVNEKVLEFFFMLLKEQDAGEDDDDESDAGFDDEEFNMIAIINSVLGSSVKELQAFDTLR
mmetsp:Transcript_7256/g.6541  ORF Transcript_7256/g.6541 Transcript_7256/m.6541 type:complete len:640 (+) Transcript_7256:894-2813(+)